MSYPRKIVLGGALAVLLHNSPASAQANPTLAEPAEEGASMLDCVRPEEAKEAKVIDFDVTSSVARLAVSLGSGRFTLVTIKGWDRPNHPRQLAPVLEAARIMQGKLQFFSRQLTSDPASSPEEFLVMAEMGGGHVCWAKPAWMMQGGSLPVAEVSKPSTPGAAPKPEAPPAAIIPAGLNANALPATAAGVNQTEGEPARTRARIRRPTVQEAAPQ